MKRIGTANRDIDIFGPGKDGFRAAVPGVSDPTSLSADFMNGIQESIVRAIELAGLDPSDDFDQFSKAITSLIDGAVTKATLTVVDFIPLAERDAVLAGTSTYDATEDVQRAIDSAGSTRRLRWLGVVNTRALSSAASVDWVFEAGANIRQIPDLYSTAHVTLAGPCIRLESARFDGNQDAMVAAQGGPGLLITGPSPILIDVAVHDYNGIGYTCNSANLGLRRGLHLGCRFDDNAGLGLSTTAASYIDFVSCTFDRNGYGFQKNRANYADTSHGFVAFGVALRLRTHHVTFTSCHACDNGREGFNVNQGSYAIKFAQCLAHGNDDGGFTIASDNTGSGLPGEGEACYDIEYFGCESYNNYTSGLVAYQVCHNVSVIGGRFYNNHRVAGNLNVATSYYSGIFFAGGSTGIHVDAKCYDDRQFLPISAVAAGVLTVPDWISGSMTVYPKVAIYAGADQTFKGYGEITAEASGSVTVTPTAFNGVTLANIGAGDYVTQAVQHCGLLADNSCRGVVSIDGFGHRLGASSASGRNVYSGAFGGGQNIYLPKERLSTRELLLNPSFDSDITTGWAYDTPGGSSTYINFGSFRRSGGALKLVAGGAEAYGNGSLITDGLQVLAGEFCEAGVWAYASSRDDARFALFWTFDNSNFYSTIVQHPGGGWRYLSIGMFVPSNVAGLFCRVATEANKTVYFDDASVRVVQSRMDPREFAFPSRFLPV